MVTRFIINLIRKISCNFLSRIQNSQDIFFCNSIIYNKHIYYAKKYINAVSSILIILFYLHLLVPKTKQKDWNKSKI